MGTTIHRHRRPITDADLDLLHRLHRGDGAAFGELYTRIAQTLTRYVAARLRDRDRSAVDDLVHDAFCDALSNPTLLDPDLVGSMLRLAAWAVNRHSWVLRTSEAGRACASGVAQLQHDATPSKGSPLQTGPPRKVKNLR